MKNKIKTFPTVLTFKNNTRTINHIPMRKTGMKAPQGTGIVVATADIQNWRETFKSHKVTHEQRHPLIIKHHHTRNCDAALKIRPSVIYLKPNRNCADFQHNSMMATFYTSYSNITSW